MFYSKENYINGRQLVVKKLLVVKLVKVCVQNCVNKVNLVQSCFSNIIQNMC